ncbi:MAG TPA: TIM barrel protein [Candidatus Methylomirabilis sp.]|nr:TIM barrel protein [Candidatus Methylomirabilis sp.]
MHGTSPATERRAREIFISSVQFDRDLKAGSRTVLSLAPLAARLGVQGVEYRDVHWKEKAAELPAVRAQLTELKLQAAYTTVTPLFSREPAMRQRLLQDIQDAQALGARLLRVNLGEEPGGADAAAIRTAARQAIQQAGNRQVHLSLENNASQPGEKLAEIRRALQEFDSLVLGTNVDFANYVTTGQDPIQAIEALAPWINYTHAKDARRTADGWQATYLGNGTLALKEIVAALDATGKRFPFCLEFPGEADPEGAIRKSLEFIASPGA